MTLDLNKSHLIGHSRREIRTNLYALFWERSFATVGILLWNEDIHIKISPCSEISERRNRR